MLYVRPTNQEKKRVCCVFPLVKKENALIKAPVRYWINWKLWPFIDNID